MVIVFRESMTMHGRQWHRDPCLYDMAGKRTLEEGSLAIKIPQQRQPDAMCTCLPAAGAGLMPNGVVNPTIYIYI